MAAPSLDEARHFLTAMFDPTQDVLGAVGQLLRTIQTTETKAMPTDGEFPVATGVKLYQRVRRDDVKNERGLFHWRVRVRVGNCIVERVAPSARDATIEAVAQLAATLREFRRLFRGLLDRLRDECGFPQPPQSQRAYWLAMDLAVRQGMTVINQLAKRPTSDGSVQEWHATALIDDLVLANGHERVPVHANDRDQVRRDASARAAHNALVVLSELVALCNPRLCETTTPESRWAARTRTPDEMVHQSMAETPVEPPQRDLSASARDATSEVQGDKARVAAYQRLLKALFTSRATVLQQLQSIQWRDELEPRYVAFSRHFSAVQRVAKKNGRFVCELRVFDGSLCLSKEGDQLATAAHNLTVDIRGWLDRLYRDWSTLATTYARVKRKKEKKTPGETLMAANETRTRVGDLVDEEPATHGTMAEYVIRVRGQIAVHRWAVKPKDAKRNASTEFRDLLEWILKASSSPQL